MYLRGATSRRRLDAWEGAKDAPERPEKRRGKQRKSLRKQDLWTTLCGPPFVVFRVNPPGSAEERENCPANQVTKKTAKSRLPCV
jgi:hypothetical protein